MRPAIRRCAQRNTRRRIGQTPRAGIARWREVARFFCANSATVEEMDDLTDYLADCFRRDPQYSLKGRTPGSLRRQMHDGVPSWAAVRVASVERSNEGQRFEIVAQRAGAAP